MLLLRCLQPISYTFVPESLGEIEDINTLNISHLSVYRIYRNYQQLAFWIIRGESLQTFKVSWQYFFMSDGHQTRIYYPLTYCQYGIYVQSYIMCLFVCIADFYRLFAMVLRIFIDFPQQRYNYSLKLTSFYLWNIPNSAYR